LNQRLAKPGASEEAADFQFPLMGFSF